MHIVKLIVGKAKHYTVRKRVVNQSVIRVELHGDANFRSYTFFIFVKVNW